MSKTVITDAEELAAIAANCEQLINSHQSLTLSTLSTKGHPAISYTPFIRDKHGTFYIFVSELAHHTPNLLANPVCSVLFAAPEKETKNIFARERAFFHCAVKEIPRDTDECEQWIDTLQDRFGKTVELLRSLNDFHLFALTPQKGQYTIGFGKAFSIENDGSLRHIVSNKK